MPALEEYELTEAEKLAKQEFKFHFKNYNVPCDIDNIDVLPLWYDERKYKRGQRYFHENRLGILSSNLVGLICLIAEPKGLQILLSTGRSSTKEAARKRYISTILHTLRWYEIDLTPGSESRKSLATVRKLHFAASNSANEKKIGYITQRELSLTVFGFMGLSLIRADFFGIKSDNQEDREAFVHLWAVLCYMIGIKDEYNICLLRFDVLEILCQMFLRYILIPLIQIELPEFKQITKLMLSELGDYLPYLDYESEMFKIKLISGLPGYQYRVDHTKTLLCRSILNQNDIDEIKHRLVNIKAIDDDRLSVDIPIIEIYKIEKCQPIDANTNLKITNFEINELERKTHSMAQLTNGECLKIYFINYEQEWCKSLNDEKFYQLSKKAQRTINFLSYGRLLLDYKISRYLIDWIMGFMLNRIRKVGDKVKSDSVFGESLKENILLKYQLIIGHILYPVLNIAINFYEFFKRT